MTRDNDIVLKANQQYMYRMCLFDMVTTRTGRGLAIPHWVLYHCDHMFTVMIIGRLGLKVNQVVWFDIFGDFS